MTMTTTDVSTIAPLTHDEAMRLQGAELDRTLTMLRGLDPAQWDAQTECPAWDVRAMYQHVLGACEAGASMRENVHQLRAGYAHRKAHGGPLEAGLSDVQVRERAELTPAQIVERLTEVAPKTVRGRRRTPGSFAITPSSRSTVLCTRPGSSGTSSTPSICVTRGCTASTPRMRSAFRSSSAPTTTVASSKTSSPNGLAVTASRSCWS